MARRGARAPAPAMAPCSSGRPDDRRSFPGSFSGSVLRLGLGLRLWLGFGLGLGVPPPSPAAQLDEGSVCWCALGRYRGAVGAHPRQRGSDERERSGPPMTRRPAPRTRPRLCRGRVQHVAALHHHHPHRVQRHSGGPGHVESDNIPRQRGTLQRRKVRLSVTWRGGSIDSSGRRAGAGARAGGASSAAKAQLPPRGGTACPTPWRPSCAG